MGTIQKTGSDSAQATDLASHISLTPNLSDSATGTETMHVTQYSGGVWVYPYGQPFTAQPTSIPTRPRDARTTHHTQDNT